MVGRFVRIALGIRGLVDKVGMAPDERRGGHPGIVSAGALARMREQTP